MRRSTTVAAIAAAGLVVLLSPPVQAHADSIRDREWIISALDLTTAHRYSQGRGVVVAVIDTGVDATHHDLAGNVLSGADFSDGDVSTGNGHTDLVGHGTGVAGIIAGHGHGPHDEDGVLGVAPQAKILPVRDGLDIGFGITPAVKWATSHGAQVICIAQGDVLGGNLPDLDTAIEAAEDANIVVVAAAGNVPIENRVGLPAALPGVIAAAGTDENGNHALVSVTGSQVVIAAPATDVVQPFPNHRYAVGTGTSVSAAVIAGAAALIRSRFPKLSAKEVVDRLTATAIDKGPPGRDFEYGYGLVNIVGALTATIPSSGVSPSAPRTVASTSPKTSARHSVAPHAGDHKTAAEVGVVAAIFVVGVALAWVLKHRHNR